VGQADGPATQPLIACQRLSPPAQADAGPPGAVLNHLDLPEADLADTRTQRFGHRFLARPAGSQRLRPATAGFDLSDREYAPCKPCPVALEHAGKASHLDNVGAHNQVMDQWATVGKAIRRTCRFLAGRHHPSHRTGQFDF
jgi:hypothetical protein